MIKFENATNGRFYYLIIKTDLLNEMVLYANYGGVGISRSRTLCAGDRDTIHKEIERISKRRLKRGYSLVS